MTRPSHNHACLDDAFGCVECNSMARAMVNETASRPAVERDIKRDHVIVGGAKCSELKPRYDQIPSVANRRIAERFSKGHTEKDGPEAARIGGEMNWQKGDAVFFRDRFNHVLDHLNTWKEERERGIPPSEDHLAAAGWGIDILMWAEEHGKL